MAAPTKSKSNLTAEQQAVFSEWKELRQKAKDALNPASGITPAVRHQRHAEYTVAARRKYNENKPAIDACIAAQGE